MTWFLPLGRDTQKGNHSIAHSQKYLTLKINPTRQWRSNPCPCACSSLLLCCCHWRVRPNALHITFWSFYDLSISFIVAVAHPPASLVLLAWVTISLSQGLAARWHNTLNRISYWRALKSQIIHGGSSTIVLTVAFCRKDKTHTLQRHTLRVLGHCLPFLSFPLYVVWVLLQRHLWAGSAHNLPCHLVDVLTESCQSSKGTFYYNILLTQCIAATTATDGVAAAAAATTPALAKAGGGRGGGGGYCRGGGMCGGCCGAVQWGFLCKEE